MPDLEPPPAAAVTVGVVLAVSILGDPHVFLCLLFHHQWVHSGHCMSPGFRAGTIWPLDHQESQILRTSARLYALYLNCALTPPPSTDTWGGQRGIRQEIRICFEGGLSNSKCPTGQARSPEDSGHTRGGTDRVALMGSGWQLLLQCSRSI